MANNIDNGKYSSICSILTNKDIYGKIEVNLACQVASTYSSIMSIAQDVNLYSKFTAELLAIDLL